MAAVGLPTLVPFFLGALAPADERRLWWVLAVIITIGWVSAAIGLRGPHQRQLHDTARMPCLRRCELRCIDAGHQYNIAALLGDPPRFAPVTVEFWCGMMRHACAGRKIIPGG